MKRSARLVPLLLAVTSIACASRIGVEFDTAEDFSGYRTWAWLPRAQAPAEPPPPYRRPGPVLETLIVEGIERELQARGFLRAEGQPPDFFVTYHIRVKRELVLRTETPADQRLDSLHQSPSYVISAPVQVMRPYERGVLVIDVAEGLERQLVWRAAFESRVRGSFGPHVTGAVADLVEHFPPAPDRLD